VFTPDGLRRRASALAGGGVLGGGCALTPRPLTADTSGAGRTLCSDATPRRGLGGGRGTSAVGSVGRVWRGRLVVPAGILARLWMFASSGASLLIRGVGSSPGTRRSSVVDPGGSSWWRGSPRVSRSPFRLRASRVVSRCPERLRIGGVPACRGRDAGMRRLGGCLGEAREHRPRSGNAGAFVASRRRFLSCLPVGF
jgi:hypothetical protein